MNFLILNIPINQVNGDILNTIRSVVFENDDGTPGNFHLLPTDATMIDVLLEAEVFMTRSQAKKNFNGKIEIPHGFSKSRHGKKRIEIAIFKPIEVNP